MENEIGTSASPVAPNLSQKRDNFPPLALSHTKKGESRSESHPCGLINEGPIWWVCACVPTDPIPLLYTFIAGPTRLWAGADVGMEVTQTTQENRHLFIPVRNDTPLNRHHQRSINGHRFRCARSSKWFHQSAAQFRAEENKMAPLTSPDQVNSAV